MFALGALHAGLALMALIFALEDPACVGLGSAAFGPEFSKEYNAPTPAEKKALEEEAARTKKMTEAYPFRDAALAPANLRKGDKMDMTDIDKAIGIAPNEAQFPGWKYVMLTAAGREDEALKAQARMEQIYVAEAKDKTGEVVPPRLRRANELASMLKRSYTDLDPTSPSAAKVKSEICRQVRTIQSTPAPGSLSTWNDTAPWKEFNC
jgi:hypothetical protein